MSKPQNLGDFEQIMLLAILRLKQAGAYGVAIRREIAERTLRRPTPGAIYTTLERLEGKGLVTSRVGDATPARGGRAKRFYEVTRAGLQALQQTHTEYRNLMDGVEVLESLYA